MNTFFKNMYQHQKLLTKLLLFYNAKKNSSLLKVKYFFNAFCWENVTF